MKQIEVSAKKIEDAIADGLRQLRVTKDEADIEILSSGGFFTKAKVRITVQEEEDKKPAAKQKIEEKPVKTEEKTVKAVENVKNLPEIKAEPVKTEEKLQPKFQLKPQAGDGKKTQETDLKQKAEAGINQEENRNTKIKKDKKRFKNNNISLERRGEKIESTAVGIKAKTALDQLITLMKVKAESVLEETEKEIYLDILGEEVGTIIGYRGEVLDAVQFIVNLICNNKNDTDIKFKRVNINTESYREKRQSTLISLAQRMAEKAVQTNKRVTLEPMKANERRVIHATLSENPNITTHSEGIEPNRRIVIYPKKDTKPAETAEQ